MKQHHIITKDVPRETIDSAHKVYQEYNDQLKLYCDRLLWWNSRVNLVSRNVSRETLHKHILHSLLLGGFSTFQDAGLVVDAGSGNGLPGIPLSLTNKNQCFVLNDVVTKKCLAMKQIFKRLNLQNITMADCSIGDFKSQEPFLLISKHAFKIKELLDMTSHLPWSGIVLYKGLNYRQELKQVSEPLSIEVFDLSRTGEFFKDKAILFINIH